MAQAKKKTAAKKTTVKKAATKATDRPVKTSPKKAHTAHHNKNASSALMWALLGVVAIGFTMWVLSQQVSITDSYNSTHEIESTTTPVTN